MKKAFTMSEVLITLGIIGIVASMTLPTIVQGVQNKDLQVRLKTTYSELNQMSELFYAEHEIPFPTWAAKKSVDQYSKEFMRYYQGGKKISNFTYSDGIDKAPYVMHNLGGVKSSTIICDDGGFWTDKSGKLYFFNNPPLAGENGPVFCVDINGKQKPNTWGKDIFVFQFTLDGLVIPMGQPHKNNPVQGAKDWQTQFFYTGQTYCSPHAAHPSNNVACAYYALQNVNPKEGRETYWGDFIR